MWQGAYRKRLEKDLRRWVEQGWVGAEQGERILADVGAHGEAHHFATRAFILMGVLLFGSGVITFFATNWQEMSRLAKLSLLLGSLWSCYGLAFFIGREGRRPALYQGLLLLGVILFGANIMLIAQIYHIDHHYPDGVMWWALGALLVAWLLHSQTVMVAALGLALLWSMLEQFDYNQALYWPYLIFLALALPAVLERRWQPALRVALVGLLGWTLIAFIQIEHWNAAWQDGARVYLLQIAFLAYLGLYLLAGWVERQRPWAEAMATLRAFAAFAALGSFYLLSFPDILKTADELPQFVWQLAHYLALAGLLGVGLLRYRSEAGRGTAMALYIRLGFVLLLAMLVFVLVNLHWVRAYPGWLALAANLIYFTALLWLVFAGVRLRQRALVNLAFLFFACALLARYFDTFWSLMNRSFFFMGGGLLLIAGGWLLERQRRRLTAAILQARGGEGP